LGAQVDLTPEEEERVIALCVEARRKFGYTVAHDVSVRAGGAHHPDNLIVLPIRDLPAHDEKEEAAVKALLAHDAPYPGAYDGGPDATRAYLWSVTSSARRRVRSPEQLPDLSAEETNRVLGLCAEAIRQTRATGVPHEVHHDVPLARGGRHHPDNLLVVPASMNAAIGDRYARTLDFLMS
jgi:hypothetical protein